MVRSLIREKVGPCRHRRCGIGV